jgi:hypothetical protein
VIGAHAVVNKIKIIKIAPKSVRLIYSPSSGSEFQFRIKFPELQS